MSRTLRSAVGVLLSLLLLVWALRDVSFGEVVERIRTADFLLLIAAVIVSLGGFHARAIRWGVLLAPVASGIPFGPRLAATYIGFAANNMLPARVGEFARAFSLSRLSAVGTAPAFATLVIERILDGLVLVGLLFISMAAPGFPSDISVAGLDIRHAALLMALVMCTVAVVLMIAVLLPEISGRLFRMSTSRLPDRVRVPLREMLVAFTTGLGVLRNPRLLLVSVVLAIAQWVFLAISFLLAFRAFDIQTVPFSGAIFLQSLIALAVAIPSSPGFFGPFEAASRIGLGLWGVPEGQAVSFAIGFHIAGFLPVTLIGIYYVWRLNLSWSVVSESEEMVEGEMQEGALPRPTGDSGP